MAAPRDILAFETALMAYVPAQDHAAGIFEAQAKPRSVPQVVQVFSTLRSVPDLSQAGKELLVGAAFLIVQGHWWGLATAAAEVLLSASPETVDQVPAQDLPPETLP